MLQPQNEIQSLYYHSDQFNIMVHISYRHGPANTKDNTFMLKDYHFYISDERCHELAFVQHSFQIFCNHLKDNSLQMEQHCILSDGCAGKLKNDRVLQWFFMLHKRNKVPHIWCQFLLDIISLVRIFSQRIKSITICIRQNKYTRHKYFHPRNHKGENPANLLRIVQPQSLCHMIIKPGNKKSPTTIYLSSLTLSLSRMLT